MYDLNSDKVLNRQRVCLKCSSYVTHEKVDDFTSVCPLCNNKLKLSKGTTAAIDSRKMKKIVAQFYDAAHKLAASKKPVKAEDSEVDAKQESAD